MNKTQKKILFSPLFTIYSPTALSTPWDTIFNSKLGWGWRERPRSCLTLPPKDKLGFFHNFHTPTLQLVFCRAGPNHWKNKWMQKICLTAADTKIFYRYKFPSNPTPKIIKKPRARFIGLVKGWLPDFLSGLDIFTWGSGDYWHSSFRKINTGPQSTN